MEKSMDFRRTNFKTGSPSRRPDRACGSAVAFSQVDPFHFLVVHQAFGITFEHDLPLGQHEAPVGKLEGYLRVLLDKQNGEAVFLPQVLEDVEETLHEQRREPCGGLVEEQELEL